MVKWLIAGFALLVAIEAAQAAIAYYPGPMGWVVAMVAASLIGIGGGRFGEIVDRLQDY